MLHINAKKIATTFVAVLVIAFGLSAQTAQSTVESARAMYQSIGFQAAFEEISKAVPEASTDMRLKSDAASLCSEMGLAEYNKKNWKNAWESFRKALKYQSTNTLATQYYLLIKKAYPDQTKLQNEGDIAAAAAAKKAQEEALRGEAARKIQEADAARKAQEAETARHAQEIENERRAAEEAKRSAEEAAIRKAQDEVALKKAIEEAVTKAQAAQPQGVTSSDLEKLVGKLENAEAASTRSAQSAASAQSESAALKAQIAQQKAITQETLKTLSKMAQMQEKKENTPPVVETDPVVKALAASVAEQRQSLETESKANRQLLTWSLGGVAFLALMAIGTIVLSMLRARSRVRDAKRYPMATFGEGPMLSAPSLGAPVLSNVPLLEFSPQERGLVRREDVDLRKQLLRAERMNKMYEDARSGSLSWETVRKYIDELDTALKTEILKVAEAKIIEGDLVSSEAVLPIIFPFLVDYDDYIHERAVKCARLAFAEEKNGSDEGHEDPFGARALMAIPEGLKTALKGRDQSIVTAKLSRSMSKILGLSNLDSQHAYLGALAHDAGYLMLDLNDLQQIIAKPEITEEDFEIIKSHTVRGPAYFGEMEVPAFIRDAILYHHERNDGSGYPDGRKKEEIPLIARVIGVAESYAALMSARPDRAPMKPESALAIIKDSRLKFDREIIDSLASVVHSNGNYQ